MRKPLSDEIQYGCFHLLRVFFESLPNWRKISSVLGISSTISQREYDDLFKGTNAAVSIPLWASACLTGEPILLNQITLDIIAFYKECGYSPIRMDGNPPDYIGEQFRFLEYLAVCGMKERGVFKNKIQGFLQQYTIDTVHELCAALLKATSHPEIQKVVSFMSDVLIGRYEGLTFPKEWLYSLESWQWPVGSAIPLEAEKIISQASYNDCGSKCKMLSRVREGCVLSIEPDSGCKGYRFTGCPRGRAYRHTFLNSGRLRYPMERIGQRGEGKFRRITWKDACEKIAFGIKSSGQAYGPGSRYVMAASGNGGLIRGDRFMKELLRLDGGYLAYYNSYSVACASCALPYVYGTDLCGNADEDMLNSKLLILWGHNPVDTHWGLTHIDNLMKAKKKGVRIVVVDPRQSDTAVIFADQWVPIRPTTDGALADAMAYVIQQKGLQDQKFLDDFCVGYDESHMPKGIPSRESYLSYLTGQKDGVPKTPVWAEKITGVPAGVIENLAIEYAVTKPACLMPGLGPQRTMNGEQTCRALAALACMTGNVGVKGGGSGGFAYRKSHMAPGFPVLKNPYPGEIPVFLWTKAADRFQDFTPGQDGLRGVSKLDTGIRVIFNLASGMLINQHSNINDTIRILKSPEKVDLIVVSDLFMTPSAKFADIILPAPSFFESENVVPPWTGEDYLLYNHQAIAPLFDCKTEYDWIKEISKIMGLEPSFTRGRETELEWLRDLYEQHRKLETELPEFEEFKRDSCFFYSHNTDYVAFQNNIQQGVPFGTPSGKIELFSKRLFDLKNPKEIPGTPSYTPCVEGPSDPLIKKYPLQLIGFHTKRRCHSMHDNNIRMDESESPAVWINPIDAQKRKISDGELVNVYNDRGAIKIPAKVTGRIMAGVVAVSEGGWYTPDSRGVDMRGCINTLTMSHKATPLAKGNPQHTNLVQIKKAD